MVPKVGLSARVSLAAKLWVRMVVRGRSATFFRLVGNDLNRGTRWYMPHFEVSEHCALIFCSQSEYGISGSIGHLMLFAGVVFEHPYSRHMLYIPSQQKLYAHPGWVVVKR